MERVLLLLSILLTSASAALSQQSQPVQFFPFGFYIDNDHLNENKAVWNFADSLDQKNVFISDMIIKIENHFPFQKMENAAGIVGLNDYLLYSVYKAYSDSVSDMGIEFRDPAYSDTVNKLFNSFIDSLIAGHETKMNRDSLWIAEIPFSVFLNLDEKNRLLNLLNIQNLYMLSSDMTVKNFDHADISYGSHPVTGSYYFHFTNDSASSKNLVFSAPENSIIEAQSPNRITTDTLQKEYKILLDSLNIYYGHYFNTELAQKFTFSSPQSNVKIHSIYNGNPFFNYWFSVLFYKNNPQCFMTGYPVAILKINSARFWIFEINTPDIGLYGFRYYIEENDSLKLYFESYLFSI